MELGRNVARMNVCYPGNTVKIFGFAVFRGRGGRAAYGRANGWVVMCGVCGEDTCGGRTMPMCDVCVCGIMSFDRVWLSMEH